MSDDDLRAPSGLFRYLLWKWRHRRCPETTTGRHDWVGVHDPAFDRVCLACKIQD